MDQQGERTLREPAHRVSPRAVDYWRVTAALGSLTVWVGLAVVLWLWPDRPGWVIALAVVAALAATVPPAVMPEVRYRVHRWEVTPTAVHTRRGWITREHRVAPLSRVQTVDSTQTGLMRLFGLRSITVTTASSAGALVVECLDERVADRVLAELTRITGEAAGDAT